jgi:hypothetical protein
MAGMGYVCPVCEDPQADGHHLANHLAFTAMLGDDAHEAWLDDHAPEWADADPAALADAVVEHATETVYPQVFEDTTDDDSQGSHSADGRDHGHRHGDTRDHDHGGSASLAGDDVPTGGVADVTDTLASDDDRSVEAVLAEARSLTRTRRAGEAEPTAGNDETADDTESTGNDETAGDTESTGDDETLGDETTTPADDGE